MRPSKIQNLNCGVTRRLTSLPVKEPIIFIAGRMVPEKGILEAALAIAKILPFYPEWKLVIAGARRFEDAPAGSYEAKVGKAIAPLGSQAEMLGLFRRRCSEVARTRRDCCLSVNMARTTGKSCG